MNASDVTCLRAHLTVQFVGQPVTHHGGGPLNIHRELWYRKHRKFAVLGTYV